MGACASVPKDLKAEVAGAAPPPEQPKEEIDTSEVPEQVVETKTEEGEEKKVDGSTGDEKPNNDIYEVVKEEKVAEDSDKQQSLDTLMNDKGEIKEETSAITTDVENKVEPSPVYDSPPEKDDAEKPSTDIVEVTKEEKNNDETTQKS